MKKLLSLLMAIIMMFTCFGFGAVSANADAFDDFLEETLKLIASADTIEWDAATKTGTHPFTINSQSVVLKEYMTVLKFKPSEKGWYEFSIDALPATGMASITVTSDDIEEDLYTTDAEGGASILGSAPLENLCTGAKLKANTDYYVMIIGSETGPYSANLNVKKHTHTFGKEEIEKAFYEYDNYFEEVVYYDGAKIAPCQHCGYIKTVETYYAPKTLTLSYTSTVYNGSKKAPKVTVKDRKGNVISSDNYNVKYKNNTKPGKATVTVTFKGKKYEGTMEKTFTIKPSKATLSSVSSNGSKKLTVKWKTDMNVSGYQIAYSTSTKFTKSTTKYVKVSDYKTAQKTISGLKGGKKYAVKVRKFKDVQGTTIYGSWSGYKTVKVKK